MGHGADSIFSVAIASAATLSSGLDLGRAWGKLYLNIPARSNTTLYVQGSSDNSTFRRIYHSGDRSGVEAVMQVASATTNAIVPIPGGIQYLKIESQDAIADGVTFKLIASDEA